MPSLKPFLDFSQYYSWLRCSAFWYEQTINRRTPQRAESQRDDPLAIGSLVHAGLEHWQLHQTISIPEDVVREIGPTPEAFNMCMSMISGYARAYPSEHWPLIRCEEPLRFPLTSTTDGLAKIDAYFYVPELTSIPSSAFGEITLTPGWWIHEYKTKDPQIDLGFWMRKWESNMQVSFQTLALENHLAHNGLEEENRAALGGQNVQGILINILEKPKTYEPKRKCKSCVASYAFDLWLPTGEGTYGCPVCGNIQKVAKLKETPVVSEPAFYRMIVQRSPQRLQRDKEAIRLVAAQMQEMRIKGMNVIPWNTESCIDPRMKKQCPYFNNHIPDFGISTLSDTSMVQIEDYVKETNV